MVTSTGVNEETPQEPATAERPGPAMAELTLAGTAAQDPAVPVGGVTKTVPADTVLTAPAAAEAQQAKTAPTEAASAEVAEVVHAVPEPKTPDAGPAEAGPAEGEVAEADPAGPALAGTGEAGPVGAELAGAGEPGPEAGRENRRGEESRDMRPLAVVGIIVGVIALVGVAAGVLAVVTHGFKPKTVVTYRPAAVFGLRSGQCVDSGSNSLNFTLVSCASPHDAEVFARFSLPAAAWPGSSAVRQEAGEGCASRLSGYLNPQLATIGLTQEYVYPNQDAWQADQRTVVCEVSAGSGRLTGSVRARS
jgi:Septum formation